MTTQESTLCLVGAGLGNGILAWFLRKRHPDLNIVIYESKSRIDEGRTWSFHKTDVGEANFAVLQELIAHSWNGYEVSFPLYKKRYDSTYATITPEKLQRELLNAGVDLQFLSPVQTVAHDHVALSDGRTLFFEAVVDGRGFTSSSARLGYQKFLGQCVRLSKPHGLQVPLLMDATVPQLDGYRFFYILPFSETEFLIEDTRYSRNSHLNQEDLTREISSYIERRGWKIERILKTESGVLPIPLDAETPTSNCFKTGMAAGFFHPVTGYSLPDSVRLADRISALSQLNRKTLLATIEAYRSEQMKRRQFYFLLNRMLFLAAPDLERRKVFEHFYRMPQSVIERFYAGNTTYLDRIRILSGRPPVNIGPALRAVFSRKVKEAL
ncbi:hypothetical protein AZI87_05785 [Bdellovibrio bacteriovorus]|uniref:Lycopene cyclase n=1 Tax=Bdellovibrio bacteriovorus TaxID=959 RepID=A0A162GR05_BDEBC|nr:lycopene beta-cyclase CrtY [Bdellovibrio bacteriovorus]KYG68741.1 hypothetical protein AZI87_05785 [Bdellovibrio bacteriovorus]